MKERPILFSAPMVRAILEGRKSQTRRIAKKMVRHPDLGNLYTPGALVIEHEPQHVIDRCCPYGQPGDRLWVREAFSGPHYQSKSSPKAWNDCDPIWYWADGNPESGDWTKPKPSIHMPHWASRISLEITGIRVERLQDISEGDARAEGIHDGGCLTCGNPEPCGCEHPAPDARDAYCHLWQKINGEGSWMGNPWVWVVEFKRV